MKKLDDLVQDFITVTNAYEELDRHVKELENTVNKKIKEVDILENLQKQVDQLDAYVYSGKKKLELGETEPLEKPEDSEFLVLPTKEEQRSNFARMVKHLMSIPDEKKAKILEMPIQTDVERVKPQSKGKGYEKFIKTVKKISDQKKFSLPPIEPIGEETVEKLDIDQPQTQAPIPVSELIVSKEKEPYFRGSAQKKFHTTTKAITLVQNMQETQRARKLDKPGRLDNLDTGHEVAEPVSVEDLESWQILPREAHLHQSKSINGKAISSYKNEKAFQQFKEWVVLHVKTCLEEMEKKVSVQMEIVVNSIVELKNEAFEKEIHVLESKLKFVEGNRNLFENRLTVIEEKVNLNDIHIREMMINLKKVADHSIVLPNVTKMDLSILEDRMLQISERTMLDVDKLRGFFKGYTVKLREELEAKVFGFEMDCRLEPLSGRLKQIEKYLRDLTMAVRVLERLSKGPFEVKRYVHCEDGRQIKSWNKPISHWTSASYSERSNQLWDDTFFEGENAKKIEDDIKKRLQKAPIFRESKHLIGGSHTKDKAT